MEISRNNFKYFTTHLLNWHRDTNQRNLPWKSEKDPYKIWLSEIMLQQTRAEQGLPYYMNFITHFPTIFDLAAAPEEKVFKMWQGLGYYNRCKNMLTTAKIIVNENNGKFPKSFEGLLQLKGIGNYTASAIASFAFGLPFAVVDGNVYRILSRFLGIYTPTDSAEGKKLIAQIAQELIDTKESAAYNQAIMDLGATICLPKNAAKCGQCPLESNCFATNNNMVDHFPIKTKKIKIEIRYFNYFIFIYDDKILIRKRTGNDIWENLYEPYLLETDEAADLNSLLPKLPIKISQSAPQTIKFIENNSQKLTHRIISTAFYEIRLPDLISFQLKETEDYSWISQIELKNFAFSKTISSFFSKNNYF